jgi:hypothetical protein
MGYKGDRQLSSSHAMADSHNRMRYFISFLVDKVQKVSRVIEPAGYALVKTTILNLTPKLLTVISNYTFIEYS